MVYYKPGVSDHGLPYDPFKACVVPRPIGWISTTSRDGKHNLAPYSQFTNLTYDPPYVMFSANQNPHQQQKDTVRNAEQTGKFCWSLATWELRDAVNASAQFLPPGEDEFVRAGLEKQFGSALEGEPVPFVAQSPVNFECKYHSTIRLPGNPPMGSVDIVIGQVVAVHIDDRVITDGRLDIQKTQPIARCGYYDYTVVRDTFEMVIPGMDEATLAGLEGSMKRSNKLIGIESGRPEERGPEL
ncbi:hypothetical protein PMIN03_003511 [Paraphaeosphaeria minitans]